MSPTQPDLLYSQHRRQVSYNTKDQIVCEYLDSSCHATTDLWLLYLSERDNTPHTEIQAGLFGDGTVRRLSLDRPSNFRANLWT